jgi:hypothetical protein
MIYYFIVHASVYSNIDEIFDVFFENATWTENEKEFILDLINFYTELSDELKKKWLEWIKNN